MTGKLIDIDPDSGAQVHLLAEDPRPTDNIYGEQPYTDAAGKFIAVRHHPNGSRQGGLSIVDLASGTQREVLAGRPEHVAFHSWSDCLYYQQMFDGQRMLRRCRYETGVSEDVALLPAEMGSFSYGTVSADQSYYAVRVSPPDGGTTGGVYLLDFATGQWRRLFHDPRYHPKHEQFSRDGRNVVLIQLNELPKIAHVLLAELTLDGDCRMFPVDHPHTPRPTGHEAWIGPTQRVFFSTIIGEEVTGQIWSAKVGDASPRLLPPGGLRFGHVSVSRCGRYWIADTDEAGVPIYAGSFETGRWCRIAFSHTVYDQQYRVHAHPYMTAGNQWLIFNSTRGGYLQVYGARLAEGWLDQL